MTILITGAFGLLGASLSRYLPQVGYEVLMQGQSSGNLVGDLTNLDFVNRLLNKTKPNFIINLAALTNVDSCEKNPNLAYLANAKIVEQLAAGIEFFENTTGHKIHLIQCSTDQVYDGQGPHHEDNISLTNYYAYSKYIGELAAIKIGGTVLRTNFFGISECPKRESFSDWAIRMLKSHEPMNVFNDVRFSPLSISSLMNAIDVVLKNPISGIFNLGSNNGMSKAEFILSLAKFCDLPVDKVRITSSVEHLQLTYRPKDMRMISQKFSQAFNFNIPNLEDQIRLISLGYVKDES